MKNKLRPASMAVATLVAIMAQGAYAQEARNSYIVQLVQAPVAAYEGGIAGLAATKPAPGTRLDVSAADVQAYMNYLTSKQNDVLASINPAHVSFRYDVVLNGFAANLTDAEVRALKKNSNVLSIEADVMLQPTTAYTPAFLGLDKPGGLWDLAGGKSNAGEDIIIAMVDSGVWPEDISFADKVDANGTPTHDASGTLAYGPAPAKWKGIGCELKPGITAANCNNKLLGVRSFVAATAPINAADFLSGRDGTAQSGGGHGTHTLSTAGGNAGVPSAINGVSMGMMSGIAPRARLAMYKTCFKGTTSTNGGCASASSVASINQAVKDGADVINYSIGPTAGGGTFTDATEVAFLNASNAGVFVAASAGNAGPTTGPSANLGPWHATVGASTHDRTVGAVVALGDGSSYVGASVNQQALNNHATLVNAIDAGVKPYALLSPADQLALRLCYTAADRASFGGSADAALDPAKVANKVVICDRGNSARVAKSQAVKDAGGVGMVLADNGAGLVAEAHSVPTIHITQADGNAVKAYAAANGAPTADLGIAQPRYGDVLAPKMANFSSRGPNVANANILKPDFTAPGVDIVAAYAPTTTAADVATLMAGGTVNKTAEGMISGTSMSSPHIAGLAALIKQQHPSWTPAMIKSALATTAKDTYDDGVNVALPWDASASANGRLPWAQGAGHVQPNLATDPGLVYDAGAIDYARFSCGLNLGIYNAATCASIGSIAAYNLNQPAITVGSVMGVQTITRTVTNVGTAPSTYSATATLPGFDVVVSPSSFTIAPGAKQTFTVKLTRNGAALDKWAYGSLVWSDGSHTVRSPLTARPTAMSTPASVYSEAKAGSKIFTIGTGFAGAMSADKGGLKAATRTANTVTGTNTGTAATICAANNSPAVKVTTVSIPADTLVARFQLTDAETTGGQIPGKQDDLDLLVLDAAGKSVAGSLNGGSNETATMLRPAAGNYRVCVIAYDLQGRPSSTYTMNSWVVTKSDTGGALKVLVPGTSYIGGTASVGMSWSGLTAGQRYLGAASFKVGGVEQGLTLLEVNANDPVPVAVNSRPATQAAD
ncbi:S8 family serine peptidase [Paucibacter sp. APW11]|uniref:S8 family serine peptidase n=1 Tax=Roseateles aquae TaxID=3077235 RepID=A0ABU3PF42_9BURK|nr:S8 family serine peptidase [Paucibacter sp. APW11]MDT9000912.1 S8 family serine peptidase [Paucibacter sp. APW11]